MRENSSKNCVFNWISPTKLASEFTAKFSLVIWLLATLPVLYPCIHHPSICCRNRHFCDFSMNRHITYNWMCEVYFELEKMLLVCQLYWIWGKSIFNFSTSSHIISLCILTILNDDDVNFLYLCITRSQTLFYFF